MPTDRDTGIPGPPKRRIRRTPTQARNHILDVAGELLADKGLRAFSLGDVAASAGYSRGTLLVYFGSIARLREALFKRLVRQLAAQLAGLSRDMPPDKYADAIVQTIFNALSSRSQALLVAWIELSGQPQMLGALRAAIAPAFDTRRGESPAGADFLRDRILTTIALAIGTGLCSHTIAKSVGPSRRGAPALAEELLRDLAGLCLRSVPPI